MRTANVGAYEAATRAIEELRSARAGHRLDGVSMTDLRDEGRR